MFFFRLRQGEFITYADGKDRKVRFKRIKIQRALPSLEQSIGAMDLEANFNKIHLEARSIFKN